MKDMTMHDRMLSVYRNQLPDRIPVSIYSRYLPRGSMEREIRNIGLGIIDYYPVVSFLAPPWHMYSGFISEVKGAELEIKYYWSKGTRYERRQYHTPVGTVYQDVSQYIGAGSEHISKYYISSLEDYKVMTYLVEHTVFRSNEKDIETRMKDLGDDGVVLGRVDRCPYQKILIELAGAERFLIDLYTNPEPVLELMEAMDRKMDEAFRMIVESKVEVIWQPDNVTSDMTPPKNFEKYCLPFYQKHGKEVRAADKPYLIHMDGRIKALKELIQQAELDGIESMSLPQINGDMTLTEARVAFPDKVIIPNFPANLCDKPKEEIEGFLEELFLEASSTRPFMLQVSEDIPVDQWERVLMILARYVKER
ncbi:MAG: uroporphyrinogen decarboxylase family protein [Clostridia bacterium]|jgi:uroporphyrinogen-III decarboxylase